MKKTLVNLKHITLTFVLAFGFFVTSNQAQAVFVYTAYDVPYLVTASNIAPVANAGPSISMCQPQSSRTISPGSATATDADGIVVSTVWTYVGGTGTSTPIITNATTLTPTMSNMINVGTYIFRLTATDNGVPPLTGTSNFTVTLTSPSNCPPPDYPELGASGPTPTSVVGGVATTYSSTVSNTGIPSTGLVSFPNIFQFDDDGDATNGVMATIQTANIGPLAQGGLAGSTAGTSVSYTFPTTTTTITRYARSCADLDVDMIPADGLVTSEINEGNNCSGWVPVTVTSVDAPVVTISFSPSNRAVTISGIQILWSATNNPTECKAPSGDWDNLGIKPVTGPESQADITTAGTYVYKLRCKNLAAGWGPEASVTITATAGTNGQCSNPAEHFKCNPLTTVSTNRIDGAAPNTPWKWTCPGTGTGNPIQCEEAFVVKKQCQDDADNDGDGLKDTDDPGCHSDGDPTNAASYKPLDDKEKNISPIWIEI